MSYVFSTNYLDADGAPITTALGASGTVRATDRSSGEQFDFDDNTWKAVATTRELALAEDANTPGRFIATFDYDTWGERNVEFLGIITAAGFAPQITERTEQFVGGGFSVAPFVPPVEGQYVTVADVRAFGITTGIVLLDADVERLIAHACQQIDSYTGQWFDKRTRTITLRGISGAELFLPLLLVTLTSIALNGDDISVDFVDSIKNQIPDDWEDPRMYLLFTLSDTEYFAITGAWGCVASIAGAVPEAVRRAALLTIAELIGFEAYGSLGSDDLMRPFIISETTDRHRYTLNTEAVNGALNSTRATILPISARTLLAPFMAPKIM